MRISKNRRNIAIITIVLITLIIIDLSIVRIIPMEVNRDDIVKDIESLEAESDLIIKGKILPWKKNILLRWDDGEVLFGYTLTKIKVEEVYKGKVVKNTVSITEEYYKENFIVGKTLYTQGAYISAKVGSSYMFFLKKYGDDTSYKGLYFPIDLEYGKYLVNNKTINELRTMTNKELEIGENANLNYIEWMDKVIAKYVK